MQHRKIIVRRKLEKAHYICYLLFAICYLLFAICYLLFAICYLLFAICYLLFAICYLLFAICYLLFAICYLLFAICYLLFASDLFSKVLECLCKTFLDINCIRYGNFRLILTILVFLFDVPKLATQLLHSLKFGTYLISAIHV